MNIQANGISMNYEITGSGENLVLIHGAGDSLAMWYHQVPALSQKYRVITYDIRGAGKTDSPEGDYSIALFVEDLYRLLQGIGVEKAYFLGYSMGCLIAANLAIKHPEMVEALILSNSAISLTPPPPETVSRRQSNIDMLNAGRKKEFIEATTLWVFSPGFIYRNPFDFKRYYDVKMENEARHMVKHWQAIIAETSPPDLEKVRCPVLILSGEKDPGVGGVGESTKLHEALPGSKLVVMPTAHAAMIELPDKYNAIVDEFLTRLKA